MVLHLAKKLGQVWWVLLHELLFDESVVMDLGHVSQARLLLTRFVLPIDVLLLFESHDFLVHELSVIMSSSCCSAPWFSILWLSILKHSIHFLPKSFLVLNNSPDRHFSWSSLRQKAPLASEWTFVVPWPRSIVASLPHIICLTDILEEPRASQSLVLFYKSLVGFW